MNSIDDHLNKIDNVKLVTFDIPAGAEDNALVFAMACDRMVSNCWGTTSFVDSYALLRQYIQNNFCVLLLIELKTKNKKELFSKFQKITTNFLI